MATTSTASSTSSQRVRQAWRLFEQWQAPARTEMQRQCNLSSTTPAKRREIEDKHYSTARGEWQRRLTSAGLKDEDWGTMTAAEKKAVELALGGEGTNSSTTTGITAGDVDNSMSLVPHAAASSTAATSNASLLQPPPQIGSSFSTSSINSSVSSYEFVSPSELVSDDDGEDDEDDGAQGFMFQVAVTTAEHDLRHQARRSASVSEDEASYNYGPSAISSSNSHYGYGLSSPTSTASQWRPFDNTPGYQHWSNSEASSRHPSANASPAQPPPKSFYTPVMSTVHPLTASSSTSSSSSSKPMPVTTSSTGWAASALASVAHSAYAAVSSSAFGSSPPEAGTAQASKPKASSASKAPSSSASASASASALVPASAFSSSSNRGSSHSKSVSASNAAATSASSASASSMAIVPRQASPAYIGPILSDSGEDDHDGSASDPYDPDDAEFEFKKFKTHTRIQKIIEFHREAAELEVRLVVEIERMRASVDHLPRDAEKKLIEGHQAQMRALQQSKELERKRIVKEERKHRRHALTAASASSSTSSLSLALVPQWNPNQPQPHPGRSEKLRNTEWLDVYDHAGSNLEVSMPGGFEFEPEPAASYNPHHQPSSSSSSPYPYDQSQAQFGHPYPDLPTPQGPYSGESFQQQQQQHNGQHWSPPKQRFSPHSSSASSSNNASPSFWDTSLPQPGTTPNVNGGANHNGRNSASIHSNPLLRRPPTVGGRRPPSLSPQIARPRPMPAWDPQQLEYSAEEDNGGPEHYENQQDYDWGQEPGYGHGQGQVRGYSPHESSMEEQWDASHSRHPTEQPQQPPAPMYETFQMPRSSFNNDDAYGNSQSASDFFGGGEMDIPDELRAAMGGYNYGQGHGEYSPSSREEREMKAREEAVRREQQDIQARLQEQQQQSTRKGMPINTSRKNSDFGREDKKGTPASLKSGNADALNSSTNTLHGGVMNKTPTTTSPLASFIPSKLNGLGFGSLWGSKGPEQPDNKQMKEEDEGLSEEEEEEEEEDDEEVEEQSPRGWFSNPPQKKQAPAPPAKKAAPPPPAPAPAPAPTTAKGRRAAAAAAKAQALAEAKAKAEAEQREKVAREAEEAEAARRAAEAAKEKEMKSAPAVPEKTTTGGKKQTKKQKQAAAKKGGNAKSEPVPPPAPAPVPPPVEETKKTWVPPASVKESKQAAEPVRKGTSSLSSSVLSTASESSWGEASSTPRPSAASIKAQAGWGDRAQQQQQQQQDVLGSSGVLRKQAVMHQAQHKQETNGATGQMPTIDTSPIPDDVRASLWSRATSRPVATPISATTPTATTTPTASNSGWKVGGSKARRGSDGAANPFNSSPPKNGISKAANGGLLSRKARNGLSSAPKKVTIEEVSDEEAEMSADGSLGIESRYLLESAEDVERQQEIAHPRPSMPPSSYNNFFGNDHYDEGFTSSANSSYAPQTPSTAPTSPPDDIPPMSNEELFSSATKNIKLQKALNGQGGGHSKSASGFASDWDATVKQKRPRWSTTTSGMRPASSATVGPGAGGPAQSAFRYKSSLAPPPMTAPMSSSESDDWTPPMGAIPGGFPPPVRGNVAGSAAGGNVNAMNAREQMRAAAAAGGGRTITSSNGPSTFGAGGRQAVETSSADSALLERFRQGQREEEMKRAMAR